MAAEHISARLSGVFQVSALTKFQWNPLPCLTCSKHLYNTIESVCGVWDVELQTVLEINKLGHRRRILQSLAYIRQMRESRSQKTPLAENNETNKMTTNGNKEATGATPTPTTTNATGSSNHHAPQATTNALPHRNSITGYRKNR